MPYPLITPFYRVMGMVVEVEVEEATEEAVVVA